MVCSSYCFCDGCLHRVGSVGHMVGWEAMFGDNELLGLVDGRVASFICRFQELSEMQTVLVRGVKETSMWELGAWVVAVICFG